MFKVFKFGGASVKDAESVKNVANIIRDFKGDDKLLCVVSAMGKTTNALELVLKQAIESKGTSMPEMQKVYEYH
ncbi:MAG TPA: aspartate kinase, partial [Bacteroidia bacterium]